MNITVDSASAARLKAAIEGTAKELKKELRIALNYTAKKAKSLTSKVVRDELAHVKKSDVDFTMKVHLIEGESSLTASLEVKKTDRISLRFFKPKQTKVGVSYQISKRGGRKTVAGAFQGPRPGLMKASWKGNAFRRKGKGRLPIAKLRGPSTWGVMTKGKKTGPSIELIDAELQKQIERRVRFITLKKTGAI